MRITLEQFDQEIVSPGNQKEIFSSKQIGYIVCLKNIKITAGKGSIPHHKNVFNIWDFLLESSASLLEVLSFLFWNG
jgi:hypothetical protein